MPRTKNSTDTLDRPATDGVPAVDGPHPLTLEELALIEQASATETRAESRPSAPTMTPPGTEGSTPGAGVWISGQKVTALWANTAPRNAYIHLQTAGWKKLAGVGDTGSTAMTLLGAHARATGTAPVVDEDPAGTIATMYVW